MADAQHTASVTLEGRVASLEKAMQQGSAQIDKLQRALDRAQATANKKSAALDKIEAAANRSSSATSRLTGAVTKFIASAAPTSIQAIIQAVSWLANTINDAAERAIDLASVFANLSVNIGGAREATHGLIADFELAKAANVAVQFQLVQSSQQFAEFAEAAVGLGAQVGTGAVDAIESLTTGLGRGSTMMLDNLGVILKQEEAHREYAKQLGLSVRALTEEQKAKAFAVIGAQRVIEQYREITTTTNETAEAVIRTKNQFINLADSALGAEDSIKNYRLAVSKLSEEQRRSLRDALAHGESAKELKNAFHDLGFEVDITRENIVKMQKILKQLEDQERRAAEELEKQRFLDRLRTEHELVDFELEKEELIARQFQDTAKLFEIERQRLEMKAKEFEAEDKHDEAKKVRRGLELIEVREALDLMVKQRQEIEKQRKEFDKYAEERKAFNAEMVAAQNAAVAQAFAKSEMSQRNPYWDPFSAANEPFNRNAEERNQLRIAAAEQARDLERAKQEVVLEESLRGIEMRKAMGADPITLLEQERDARLRHTDFLIQQASTEIEMLALKDQRRQVLHAAEIKRIEQENKARKASAQVIASVGNTAANVFEGTARAAISAAMQQGKGIGKAVQEYAGSTAVEMGITGTAELIRGLVEAVGSYGTSPKAYAHFANSAQAFAAAAVFGGIAGVAGAASGHGSGRVHSAMGMSTDTRSLGVVGAQAANDGGPWSRGIIDSDVPGSPRPPTAANSRGASRRESITFEGDVHLYGVPPDDFLTSIDRGLERHAMLRKRRSDQD